MLLRAHPEPQKLIQPLNIDKAWAVVHIALCEPHMSSRQDLRSSILIRVLHGTYYHGLLYLSY